MYDARTRLVHKEDVVSHYFLEKCEFIRIFLWIIAKMGVFLFWKNAEHVGKKNFALY